MKNYEETIWYEGLCREFAKASIEIINHHSAKNYEDIGKEITRLYREIFE